MAFFVGLFIGFLMCIPIGPINVWVINTHLKRSATKALSIAAGGSLMDVVYFFVILSGLSLFEISEEVTFYFKVVGISLIFILGLKELVSRQVTVEVEKTKETPKSVLAGLLLGVAIYTSNPTLIFTMTGLGAFVKSLDLFSMSRLNIIMISFGLGIGSFLWFVFLVKVVDRFKEKIRNNYLTIFTRVSGGLMIGLSLFMGHKLYS